MAQINADGSIILSTQIDTDGIEQGLKELEKLVKSVKIDVNSAKQLTAAEKLLREVEKTKQEQSKTRTQLLKEQEALMKADAALANAMSAEEKAKQEQLKTDKARSDAMSAEEKAKQTQLRTQALENEQQQKIAKETSNLQKSLDSATREAQTGVDKISGILDSFGTDVEEDTTDTVSKVIGIINSNGVQKAFSVISKGASKVTDLFRTAGKTIVNDVTSTFDKILSKTEKQTNAFDELGKKLLAAFSISKITQFSKTASQNALTLESQLVRLKNLYGENSDLVGDFIDKNAVALGLARTSAIDLASTYGNIFNTYVGDSEASANLVIDYLNMTSVVASKTGRTIDDIQDRVVSGLLGNTKAIDDLGIYANESIITMSKAFEKYANGRSWAQLNENERKLIRTLAILEQSTNQYGTEVQRTSQFIQTSLSSAWEDFKSTWGQIVNLVVVPLMEKLTVVLKIVTSILNKLLNKGDGVLDSVDGIMSAVDKTKENIGDLNNELEDTVDLTQRILAGFDDIQKLGEETSATGSGGFGNFDYFAKTPDIDDTALEKTIDNAMELLDVIIDYIPIAMVAIGVILMAFGQIGWGVGFIVGGAYMYSVAEKPTKETDVTTRISNDLKALWNNIDQYLTAVGLVLILFGQFAWGIGFLIAGAVAHSVKAYNEARVSGATKDEAIKQVQDIAAEVATALAAIGVILIVLGQLGWGVGFIIASAALYEVSQATISEFNMETVKQLIADVGGAIAAALEVIGVILLCTGHLALGVTCLIASDWIDKVVQEQGGKGKDETSVSDMVKNFMTENKKMLETIAEVLFVVGLILMCTGSILTGLGLILGSFTLKDVIEGEDVTWIKGLTESDGPIKNIKSIFEATLTVLKSFAPLLIFAGFVLIAMGSVVKGVGLVFLGWTAQTVTVTEGDETISSWLKEKFSEPDVVNTISKISSALCVVGIVMCAMGMWGKGALLLAAGAFGLPWVTSQTKGESFDTFISNWAYKNFGKLSATVLVAVGLALMSSGNIALGAACLAGAGAAAILDYFRTEEKEPASSVSKGQSYMWNVLEYALRQSGYDTSQKAYRDVISGYVASPENKTSQQQLKNLTGQDYYYWERAYANSFGEREDNETSKKLDQLNDALKDRLNDINLTVNDGFNMVADAYNATLSKMVETTNALQKAYSGGGVTTVKQNKTISYRAKGAVIPPNQEFLAIYGDQRKGVNIETPLATMIDAFNTALDKRGGNGDGTVHVHVHLDGKEIYETVVKKNRENTRITGINEFAY